MAFGGQPLIEAEAVLEAALPEEGCALVLGTAVERTWQVMLLWPCLNRWQPAQERCRRFAIDPREQLLAQKWARARGWQVLGSLHSHPETAPTPSDLDSCLAVRPCLLIIGAPKTAGTPGAWAWRAWWLPERASGGPRQAPLASIAIPVDSARVPAAPARTGSGWAAGEN